MPIDHLDGVTDEDLFKDASGADEEIQVEEPASEEPVAEPEQPRDEAGRFAGKPAEEPEQPTATDPPAPAQVDDNAAMVPSWRVREINEERRQVAAENERIKAELAQLRQAPLPRQEQPKAEAPARPDPLLDPEGYAAAIREEIRQENLAERREESLLRARETNQQEFDEAYAAAQKAVDPALRARMQTSRDPGKTLLEWHRQNKTMQEVGNDLTAFRQREQERLLSDPAFLAKAIEKARASAQPSPGARPASAVNLPPSLTRATNASADLAADDNDLSDEGLWRQANA